MAQIKVEVILISQTCITCGVTFGMPEQYDNRRLEDHTDFCCPNGHLQHYTAETEEERLRKLFLKEREAKTQLETELTALKMRVDAGMCPHCHRHFANVERHIKAKHSK